MSAITKERLQWLANISGRDDIDDIDGGEIRELARIALASLEAEPLCYLTWHQGFRAPDDCEEYVVEAKPGDKSCDGTPAFPVYTAPPVPVSVPTFEKWCELTEQKPVGWVRDAMKEAYDACRAAMLHSAELVSQTYKLNEMSGNSPVTPSVWMSCSERMPDTKTAVLVAVEFDRKGDWRMKWATYIPGHPDANDGWIIPGASWKPSHWMPLPEPPL
ncbi:TPA: DUF551 domain-containing protein [Escherichia coli]|uniref:DUF551 domain-containing protein n=1 Tax=Escherichia coli TaxID=562 RepID=UPI00118481FA|nr:DUF551 domain-containing protein [Escherichia coli]TSB70850.1 DUF551 domain-containing protein [Escherichia coli]